MHPAIEDRYLLVLIQTNTDIYRDEHHCKYDRIRVATNKDIVHEHDGCDDSPIGETVNASTRRRDGGG